MHFNLVQRFYSGKTVAQAVRGEQAALKMSKAVLAIGFGVFVTTAHADTNLPPGATVTLTGSPFNTLGGVVPGATEIASTTGQPVSLIPGGLAGVTVNEAVYSDPNGTLDYLYQVVNGSTSSIGSDAITNYADPNSTAYQINVGYATVLPTGGPFTTLGTLGEPNTVTRTATLGAQNTFNQSPALAAGTTSEIFWLRTNSTSYDNSGTFTVNGTSTNVGVVYEPAGIAAVPEPTTLGLGVAAGSLALLRRRGRSAINR